MVIEINVMPRIPLIKFKFEIGVYTLSTFEETFNIEIRKNPSNGCLDVFVIQNNLEKK